MKKWLRRIGGAVRMGLTWAVAWLPIGAIVGLATLGMGLPGGFGMVVAAVSYTGFLCGAAFSVVLAIAGGRSRFDQMSLPRFARYGAVAGGLLSILALVTQLVAGGAQPAALAIGVVVFSTLLGAGSAAGSLALARRADDRELLEHGADVADIGLTTSEKRELLGK